MKSLKEIISGPAFKLLGYRPQQVSVDAWDREYRDGGWKYLETIGSIAGLAAILGYVQFLAPETILDVGCGAGLLASKLMVLPFRSYLGVDISALFEGADTTSRPGLSAEAYELAVTYDKLRSTAGKEAVMTIVTLMSGEDVYA